MARLAMRVTARRTARRACFVARVCVAQVRKARPRHRFARRIKARRCSLARRLAARDCVCQILTVPRSLRCCIVVQCATARRALRRAPRTDLHVRTPPSSSRCCIRKRVVCNTCRCRFASANDNDQAANGRDSSLCCQRRAHRLTISRIRRSSTQSPAHCTNALARARLALRSTTRRKRSSCLLLSAVAAVH